MDADYVEWLLRFYDALQGCGWNYFAVFGVPLIDLPKHVADDLQALSQREAQVNAGKA